MKKDVRPWWRYQEADPETVALWAGVWRDGRVSLISAPSYELDFRRISSRLHEAAGRQPDAQRIPLHRLSSVHSLSMDIAARAEDNEPRVGHLRTSAGELTWSAPHSGGEYKPPPHRRREIDPETLDAHKCALWCYVIRGSELAFFTADTLKAAHRHVVTEIDGKAPRNEIVPVDAVVLDLAPDACGFAPTRYRLWIDGEKVGWPRPAPDPADSEDPPPGPLHAEARLGIPRWSALDCYAPGRPIKTGTRN